MFPINVRKERLKCVDSPFAATFRRFDDYLWLGRRASANLGENRAFTMRAIHHNSRCKRAALALLWDCGGSWLNPEQ